MADRVVLFLDYQNVYKGARASFHDELNPRHTCGQIHPVKLGQLIVDNGRFDRTLSQVRVYRGRPDSSRDPKGYGACTRQIDAWRKSPLVHVTTRTLRYPRGWPSESQAGERPQEKGIDVALALDYVTLALADAYDVGILMSTDTDMKPALEAVHKLRGPKVVFPRPEVAAWSGTNMHNRRLSISGTNLWCHWLDEDCYRKVRDDTNYV